MMAPVFSTSTGTVPAGLSIEKLVPSLEGALLDEIGIDAVFGENEADETGMRVEGMMIKLGH